MVLTADPNDLAIGLQSFGLTQYEAKVYLALINSGPCSVNELQYRSGVPRTKVYFVALRLQRKGIVSAIEGKPIRFQALAPEDIFHSAILDGEKRVRAQRKLLFSLKKMRDAKLLPQDILEEKYLSLGSQSILTRLKDSILTAQKSIKCILDGWGLHLIQESSEQLDIALKHDVQVKIVSALPSSSESYLAFPGAEVKYGPHLAGMNAVIVDQRELMLVNSQTGRGFVFVLNELRSILGQDLFEEYWRRALSGKTAVAASIMSDNAPVLADPLPISRLFIEAVSRGIRDEKMMADVGAQFLALVEERISPKLRLESFESSINLIAALMEEEVGGGAKVSFEPLTRLVTMELPNSGAAPPNSVWFFALAGLLKKFGMPIVVLQDTDYPDEKLRVIQAKIASSGT